LNPLRGILPESEIEAVVRRVQAHNGLISYKTEVDGRKIPYELNINYFDALNNPNTDEPLDVQIDRFVTAHAILLAMKGMPAIYFHSLVGSRSWQEGVQLTGHNRTINRRKFQWDELVDVISDPNSRQARVFFRLGNLLKIRRRYTAFHPHGSQNVISVAPEFFGLLRSSPTGTDHVLCLHNISDRSVTLENFQLPEKVLPNPRNLINGKFIDIDAISIEPYQTLWIASDS
jgi:sucrose phosphorylase